MNKRDFLWQSGGGLGGIALSSMIGMDKLEGANTDRVLNHPHHRPKAKRVIQLFMGGAASHISCSLEPRLDLRRNHYSRMLNMTAAVISTTIVPTEIRLVGVAFNKIHW